MQVCCSAPIFAALAPESYMIIVDRPIPQATMKLHAGLVIPVSSVFIWKSEKTYETGLCLGAAANTAALNAPRATKFHIAPNVEYHAVTREGAEQQTVMRKMTAA